MIVNGKKVLTIIRTVGTADVKLQEKTFTPDNFGKEITPSAGYVGLSKVTVEPIPEEYVIPNLQEKTITKNGVYTADTGYDGLGIVYVNVPQESGGSTVELNEITSFSTLDELWSELPSASAGSLFQYIGGEEGINESGSWVSQDSIGQTENGMDIYGKITLINNESGIFAVTLNVVETRNEETWEIEYIDYYYELVQIGKA